MRATLDMRGQFGGSKFRGTWQASADVRTNVTEGAVKEFIYELKRIRDEKVSTAELENAKRALTGGFALSLEQPQRLLQNIIAQKLYDLPADYWDTYPLKVSAVTAEDERRVAQKYVDLAHLQIASPRRRPPPGQLVTSEPAGGTKIAMRFTEHGDT